MQIFAKLQTVGEGFMYPLLLLGISAELLLHFVAFGAVLYFQEKMLSEMRGRSPNVFATFTTFEPAPFTPANPDFASREAKTFLSLHADFRRALIGAVCLCGIDMATLLYAVGFGMYWRYRGYRSSRLDLMQDARKRSDATDSSTPLNVSEKDRNNVSCQEKMRVVISKCRKWISCFFFFLLVISSFALSVYVSIVFIYNLSAFSNFYPDIAKEKNIQVLGKKMGIFPPVVCFFIQILILLFGYNIHATFIRVTSSSPS